MGRIAQLEAELPLDHHGELLAPVARHEVHAADRFLEQVRDFAQHVVADEVALQLLHAHDVQVVSEESGVSGNRDARVTVVLDPVDGSTNASRHLPYWATSLCALDADGPLAAMVVNHATGWVTTAVRGGGAFRYRARQIQNGAERETNGRVSRRGDEVRAEIVSSAGPSQLVLPPPTLMPIAAIGHSGAYRTIASWLKSPRLTRVVLLDGLYAVHDSSGTFSRFRDEDKTGENRQKLADLTPVRHPVVRVHPESAAIFLPVSKASLREPVM